MPDVTLTDIACILKRRLRWIILATLAGVAVSASVVFAFNDEYRAEGLLLIGGPSGNNAEIEGIRVTRDSFSAPAIKQLAVSDQILRRVAVDMLAAGWVRQERVPWPSAVIPALKTLLQRVAATLGAAFRDSAPADPISLLGVQLRRHVTVTAELDSGIVILSYTDTSPEQAASIANSIMAAVVADRNSLIDRERSATEALLQQRLELMKSEIDRRTHEIALLRQHLELDSAPGGGTVLDRSITEAVRTLNAAAVDLAAARARFASAKQALSEDAVSNRDSGMVISPLMEKLRQDQAKAFQALAEHTTSYGSRHPDMVGLGGELKRITTAISDENTRVMADLRNAITTGEAREAAARRNLDELRQLQGTGIADRYMVTVRESQVAALKSDFDQMVKLLGHYKLSGNNDSGGVRLAAVALPPLLASGPHRRAAILFGAAIGLVGSVIFSLLRDTLSGSFATPERYGDLIRARWVCAVPTLSRHVARRALRQVLEQGRSEREIRHRIVSDIARWLLAHRAGRGISVTITSAVAGEGKTTLSALLGRSAAAMGFRTLLIDGDLLRGMPTEELGRLNVVCGPGEETGSIAAICKVQETSVSGLLVGVAHDYRNLHRDCDEDREYRRRLQELTSRFDLVLITTSPLLDETESLFIGQVSDLMVMVYDWKRAGVGRLIDAATRQRMLGSGIDLLILNRFAGRQWKSSRWSKLLRAFPTFWKVRT